MMELVTGRAEIGAADFEGVYLVGCVNLLQTGQGC